MSGIPSDEAVKTYVGSWGEYLDSIGVSPDEEYEEYWGNEDNIDHYDGYDPTSEECNLCPNCQECGKAFDEEISKLHQEKVKNESV